MRPEPFVKLRTALVEAATRALRQAQGIYMQPRKDKPASLSTRNLQQTRIDRVMSNAEACWPDGQIRRPRVRVLAVD